MSTTDTKKRNGVVTANSATGNPLLDQLVEQLQGGKAITGDEVEFHDGPKISLPRGMTFGKAYEVLERLEEQAEAETTFERKFMYRPDDGAWATMQVIKRDYGMLMSTGQQGFSGKEPAETRNIMVGVGRSEQVPWGQIEIPVFPGLVLTLCDRHADRDYGKIFEIHATGPRKYKDELDVFFNRISEYLKNHSIYRGKAIIGADSPEFLDLSGFDPAKIVFSDAVYEVLDGALWAPIKYTDAMRKAKVPLKRAVLAFGPYGTGKTSTGQLTAKVAVDNGWTFISARPGRDKVEDVLRTARLYQPAVVFIEDIDGSTSSGEDDHVTTLLDAFDGITAKGGELMILMTTNHIERIHKGMLRPGRLDAVIEIAELDAPGVERLIKAVIPEEKRDPNIDYAAVGKAMTGFLPAFVVESITRAVTFSINRLDGDDNYTIGTDDLTGAALSLIPQLELQDDAGTGTKRPALDSALRGVVEGAVSELTVKYDDRQEWEISPRRQAIEA